MRQLLAFALAAALGLAGCLGASSDPEAPPSEVLTNSSGGDRPEPTRGNVSTGPSAPPDLNLTLETAPKLTVGEWWRIKFSSPLDGLEVEFVRVVAGETDEHYLFGMPHEGWYKEAVIYHTPAFGEVNKADLSYDTHDELFRPLQFPLVDGATWKTTFSGRPEVTATVKVLDDGTAKITYSGGTNAAGQPTQAYEAIYDPKIHEIRSFTDKTTVSFEVIDHGYGFEGWITIPRGEDLVFIHGRFAGMGFGLQPALPTEEIEITEDYNRVTFVQIVGLSLNPALHGVGLYRETVTDPEGKTYVTEATAAGTYKIQFFENANPKGKWKLEHIAIGPGVAFTEGIAYHQYDIHLPDGRTRGDHSHHVTR
ncbi:MAG TPA: hypothetical protein VM889_00495 [Candidatus Thermoplasmatota archaeon]|nr:hypothetical protein [Candidatus Thermoplasmatota archaeon]